MAHIEFLKMASSILVLSRAVLDGDDGAMVGSKLVYPKQVDHSVDALTQAAQSHVEEKVHLQSENKSVEGGFFMELIFLIH